MLNELKNIVKAYGDSATAQKEAFQEESKRIHENYSGGLYDTMMAEVKDMYEANISALRTTQIASVNAFIDGIKGKISAIASEPVDPTFEATILAFKMMEAPTQAEIQSLFDRYGTTYYSYRAICGLVGGSSKGYKTIPFDELLEDLETIRKDAIGFIHEDSSKGYIINEYNYLNFVNGNYLDSVNEETTKFLRRRFQTVNYDDKGASISTEE